jgi:hypothetical protein
VTDSGWDLVLMAYAYTVKMYGCVSITRSK